MDIKELKNKKQEMMECFTERQEGTYLSSNTGLLINDDQNSLRIGERGPTVLEDHLLREKITHFDHERIPERVVHARGSGAHGIFQVYDNSMSKYTKAKFLTDPTRITPVFTRFSTVAGSRGSTDLARDVRGFAVKFYTEEGNFDLVGNNMPVFFIQDAIKFPDLIHAVKPEPDHEMPQAASAHDTFWDFISLMPESLHMVLWLMSDRAIPRSYRMMEGFGVHTFRLINESNKSTFVKFHWKPLLGVHSVTWNEAQKISGFDPDFHRRDLWDSIVDGCFPEYELGVQLIDEEDEEKFEFDLLDSTKIVPEELIPVKRIGKLTLNRNPIDFFAETEQVAFHLGHVVPGIDFTNDPLLQGRLFSYLDTQLTRLGGPNFNELAINRSIAPIHNHQKDGFMRMGVKGSRITYEPNSLGSGCPFQAMISQGGYHSFPAHVEGQKRRGRRSEKFRDHISQAALFWRSQSEYEKEHLVSAFHFELGKVVTTPIRERMVGLLSLVDKSLAQRVANGLGLSVPQSLEQPINRSYSADEEVENVQPIIKNQSPLQSPALSMEFTVKNTIASRKIAVLIAEGFSFGEYEEMRRALRSSNAVVQTVAPHAGFIRSVEGTNVKADFSFLTCSSVLFDGVYIPGGEESAKRLSAEADAYQFVADAYRHCKSICATGDGVVFLNRTFAGRNGDNDGVITSPSPDSSIPLFIQSIAQHRHWHREASRKVPS